MPDGVDMPEEMERREDRLRGDGCGQGQVCPGRGTLSRKAEYDEKMHRAAKEVESAKKPSGKPPKVPEPGPRARDQINLTDEESRIMTVARGGYEQAYNAQAAVDAATMLVVATGLTQAPNDKEQVEPMLVTLQGQAEALGAVECLIADSGFGSQKNIEACEAAGIDPLIAVARDAHHPGWRERHSEPAPLPEDATPLQAMAHRLQTKAGRGSTPYASRRSSRSSASSNR